MKTVTLSNLLPKHLHQFWARKLLPQPSKDRVNGLSDAIAEGITLPPGYLFQDAHGQQWLVAGEGRRQAYLARQKDMTFFVVTDEAIAVKIAMQENSNRLHYPHKYQLVWDSCALIEQVAVESKKRALASLKTGNNSPADTNVRRGDLPANIDDCAKLLGVHSNTVDKILGVYRQALEWDKKHSPRKFGDAEKAMTALDFITARVHDEDVPCSPGQAWAGIAGSDAGAEGKTKPIAKTAQLLLAGFEAIGKWGKKYEAFNPKERKDVLDSIKKTVAALPPELRHELASEIKRLERAEKEAA